MRSCCVYSIPPPVIHCTFDWTWTGWMATAEQNLMSHHPLINFTSIKLNWCWLTLIGNIVLPPEHGTGVSHHISDQYDNVIPVPGTHILAQWSPWRALNLWILRSVCVALDGDNIIFPVILWWWQWHCNWGLGYVMWPFKLTMSMTLSFHCFSWPRFSYWNFLIISQRIFCLTLQLPNNSGAGNKWGSARGMWRLITSHCTVLATTPQVIEVFQSVLL